MLVKRVLTVESFDDLGTRELLKMIYSSNEFKDYEIRHCFFMENFHRKINSIEFYKFFGENIDKFQPEAILIHTGGSYYENEESFIETIKKIKAEFPRILFGIQKRTRQKISIQNILDKNEELLILEDLFFKIKR